MRRQCAVVRGTEDIGGIHDAVGPGEADGGSVAGRLGVEEEAAADNFAGQVEPLLAHVGEELGALGGRCPDAKTRHEGIDGLVDRLALAGDADAEPADDGAGQRQRERGEQQRYNHQAQTILLPDARLEEHCQRGDKADAAGVLALGEKRHASEKHGIDQNELSSRERTASTSDARTPAMGSRR